MSKCIATIPLSSVSRLSLVEAGGRSMAQVKEALGCQYIINAWFYNMNTGKAVGNLCIDGEVKARANWAGYGLTWDTGPDIRMEVVPGAKAGRSYLSGVELLTPTRGPEEPASYSAEYGGKRGRSAALLAGEYLILYCSGDGTADAKTPDAMRDELVELGGRYTNTASLRLLGLDSGGSSQCDFDGLGKIYSSRRVAGYLCVWTKESGQEPPEQEERPVSRKTVCLDPGHGPGCVNGAPDGSYKEQEFTWDLYTRIAPLLEARGVRAICTRTEDTSPSLTERAGVSNRAGADCYVSIHSNAAGNDGWYDASGLEIYTSAGPETAQRRRGGPAQLSHQAPDVYRAGKDRRPRLPHRVRFPHLESGCGKAEGLRLPGQAGRGHRPGALRLAGGGLAGADGRCVRVGHRRGQAGGRRAHQQPGLLEGRGLLCRECAGPAH